MRITVIGRHADISEALKDYADEKAGKLDRFYDRLHSVEVVFDLDGIRHRCEIIAKADHAATFVAREEHEDSFASLDAAVKDLERQLTRHKERFRNRKHPGGHGGEPEAWEPPLGPTSNENPREGEAS
jgi:putative sigma-54 modulation protein